MSERDDPTNDDSTESVHVDLTDEAVDALKDGHRLDGDDLVDGTPVEVIIRPASRNIENTGVTRPVDNPSDPVEEHLARLADAVETQNAVLLEHIRTTERAGLSLDERMEGAERSLTAVETDVEDAEHELGYRASFSRIRDVDEQERRRDE